jgi:hypothetical protein
MEEAYTGLRWNLFPTIGANGPCQVHVNLGQMGFVFVEANVKKWGLAPSQGTLSPPPAYGTERDTVLLAMGHSRQQDAVLIDMNGTAQQPMHRPPPYHLAAVTAAANEDTTHHQQQSSLLD